MKTFLRRSGIFAIVFLIANLFFVNNSFGQVTQVNAWAQQYASATYPTGAINASYAVPNGTNRLLVVAVATTRTANGSQTCTVTYGGVTLTQAAGDGTVTNQWNHTFLFYLNDANIGSAAAGKSLNVTVSNGTSYYTYVAAASFANVDQAAPTTSAVNFNTNGNNSTNVGALSGFNAASGDRGVSVINLARDATVQLFGPYLRSQQLGLRHL